MKNSVDAKTPLITLTQKQLLLYASEVSSYDENEMLEALQECRGYDDLSTEEKQRRDALVELLERSRELSWMTEFFLAYGMRQFKIEDVVSWAQKNLDFETPPDEESFKFERKLFQRFHAIVEDLVEVELISIRPEECYRIVPSSQNPLYPVGLAGEGDAEWPMSG